MALYDNLVLEGGGTKGYSYIGIARQLERLGILKEIKNVAGASVGGIGALLVATGWSAAKIESLFMKLDLSALIQGAWYNNVLIPYTATSKLGLYEGKALMALFKQIVKEVTGKENTTFAEWHELKEKRPELGLKDIFLEACNLNSRKNETFSHLSKHKDVPIVDALRASVAFPLVFTPWKIKGKLYGDGGLQNNCPYSVFEQRRGQFNPRTFCARLDDADEINYFQKGMTPPAKSINNLFQCAEAHFNSALEAQNFNFYNTQYPNSTLFCDTLGLGTFEMDMTEDQKKALVASGEYGVTRFIVKKHPDLAAQFYDKQTIESILRADCPISFSQFVMKSQQIQTQQRGAVRKQATAKQIPVACKHDKHGKPILPLLAKWRDFSRLEFISKRDKPASRSKPKLINENRHPTMRTRHRVST